MKKTLHIGFKDPSDARGTEEEVLKEFRKIREQIKNNFSELYYKELKD